MIVKTKILDKSIETAKLQYAKEGDAGIDLTATSKTYDENGNIVYGTNRAFEIPKGYVGLLFPRSSNASKDLLLSNSVGVIDSGYRGEVFMKFKNGINPEKVMTQIIKLVSEEFIPKNEKDINVFLNEFKDDFKPLSDYEIGDRIGQLIILPYPTIEFEESEELSKTERGANGYGHTGK